MSFLKLAAELWRDFATDGVPASGAHNPVKADLRQWGLTVEAGITNLYPRFTWDTGTTDADPGEGNIRANHASLASATVLYISETDVNGTDLAAWLATLDDSTNTIRGTVILRDLADPANVAIFHLTGVTDDTDYQKLAVTYVTHGGAFTAGIALGLQFVRAGDAASVGGSLGATDNRLVRTDGTGGATAQNSPISCDDSGNLSGVGTVACGPITQSGVLVWRTVVKTADETISSDNTLSADAALVFAMLANTKYAFRARIFFDTTAAADFKWRHAGPASPTLVRIQRCWSLPGGSAFAGIATDVAYSASDLSLTGSGTNGGYIEIDGIIHNGANAGNFEFRWSQDTSDAGNTVVRAGSYIDYRAL